MAWFSAWWCPIPEIIWEAGRFRLPERPEARHPGDIAEFDAAAPRAAPHTDRAVAIGTVATTPTPAKRTTMHLQTTGTPGSGNQPPADP